MASNQSTSLPLTTKPKTSGNECCGRFGDEIRHPAFYHEEVSGEVIHGPATFAPGGRWVLFTKTVLTLWTASALVDGILEEYYQGARVFYLAYLTHWSLIVTIAYLFTSWLQTVQTITAKADTTTTVTFFHKITWALFALAAPAEVVVAIGYWGLEWDGSSTAFFYRNLMVHGLVIGIVLVDGLLLNRIPLRVRHVGLNAAYFTLYFIWTLIHALAGIGNPTTPEEDDTLYTALQWKSDPVSTLQTAAQMLFLLVPLAFLFVYGLSLYSFPCGFHGGSRRYVSKAETSDYMEMTSTAGTV